MMKKNKAPKMPKILTNIPIKATVAQAFTIFGDTQPLLTAGNSEQLNTMTIGWGGLGTLWGMPVCSVYVRPSRYTYEFMEENEYFSVSFFPEAMKDKLSICGSLSGRDVDKVQECGLTVKYGEQDIPYFEEAGTVLLCKKIYYQDLDFSTLHDGRIDEYYKDGDVHRTYVGEVVGVLTK